jgi:hypothetical protein
MIEMSWTQGGHMSKHLFAIVIGIIIAGFIIEFSQRHLLKKRIENVLKKAELDLQRFAVIVSIMTKQGLHNGLIVAQLFERSASDLDRLCNMREYSTAEKNPELYKKAQELQGNIAALDAFFRGCHDRSDDLHDSTQVLFNTSLPAAIRSIEDLPTLTYEHRKALSSTKQLVKDFSEQHVDLSTEDLRAWSARGLYHFVLLRNNKFFC